MRTSIRILDAHNFAFYLLFMNAAPRKPTNLTLDTSLIAEARALNVNLSRAAEEGLRAAVRSRRQQIWREENADALASSNDYVEKHGLPLERFRLF